MLEAKTVEQIESMDIAEFRTWLAPATREDYDAMPSDVYAAHCAKGSPTNAGNMFDEKWSFIPGQGIQFDFTPRYRLVLNEIQQVAKGLEPPVVICDVGCWQGHLILELAQRGYQVRGVDIAPPLGQGIEYRTSLLQPAHRANMLGFTPGCAHEVLPHLPISDIVTCQEMLEHVPEALLQPTCDALLAAAETAVIISVPWWDDGAQTHVRVWTDEMLRHHLHADKYRVKINREGWCLATVTK